MGQFDGKVAFITGAAGGIGAATARLFAQNGMTVALVDLPVTHGEEVAQDIREAGGKAVFIPTDLRQEAQVQTAVQQTRDAFGALHYLVNVAGINRHARVEDMSIHDWDIMMEVNVRGMFLTMKHCVPLIRAAGGGAIVNMASVSAFVGSDGYAAYVTTKSAVLGLTRSVAQEFAPYNIRVNAICPGWVDTPFTDEGVALADDPEALRKSANDAHLLGRIAKPKEIADAALFLISEQASFITAESLFVDGGFMVKR
jgi:NAD(P)-dependent dehydrogenase (short-subunit alcohol dehydrogenase family)